MSYTLPDRMSEIMSEYIVHQGGNHSRNFHFAIPRIKEDDLDKIIVVQNSGGPNTCSFWGWDSCPPTYMVELCCENFHSQV